MINISKNIFIDIHTHKPSDSTNIIAVQNKYTSNVALESSHKNTLYSVGLHPWHIGSQSEIAILTLTELVKLKEVIAIGEIGLDKNIDVPLEEQINIFKRQLEIAKSVNKPVIIHCVKAYYDLLSLKKKFFPEDSWIIHGFNGSTEIADEYIANNCLFSFGHFLFNQNTKAAKVISQIDTTKIFFETDESDYSIVDIYKKASELIGISIDELKNIIRGNFERSFRI